MYYTVTASFAFLHADGTPLVLDGTIDIARRPPANQTIPSLLGWDILRHFDVRLNYPERIVDLNPLA
jgi:hypothetical protein